MGNCPDSWWADFCLYTRQIEIGPRRGQMQLFYFSGPTKFTDLRGIYGPRRITGSPKVLDDGWNGRLEGKSEERRFSTWSGKRSRGWLGGLTG